MHTAGFVKVESSNIDAVARDTEGTMLVRFKNGKTYRYDNVSSELFEQFMSAESAGSFFAKHIRPTFPGKEFTMKTGDEVHAWLSNLLMRSKADPAPSRPEDLTQALKEFLLS